MRRRDVLKILGLGVLMPYGTAVGQGYSQPPVSRLVIITGAAGSGIFVYNGQPASGNLVMSISPGAGTDRFGNIYFSGYSTYTGNGTFDDFVSYTSHGIFFGTNQNGSGGTGALEFTVPTQIRVQGTMVSTNPNTANSPENHHNMTPLQNSWSNSGGGEVDAKYQLKPDGIRVFVLGRITHAAISGASIFFTMPSGYVPASNQNFGSCSVNTATNAYAASTSSTKLRILTNGDIEFIALPAGTTDVSFEGEYDLNA